ncbi:BREX-1 system adenine-specific DNA-methyltransferase PglX [Salinicoccus roseus]|uniref:BREX-1 system adenine-specific DNA-methyltransferase PglX n=1 Tax=Salinicoccus roseus TaxID=45670 RepID=UPI00352481EA
MNKSALRTFATNARRELLEKVKAKAMKIGITEEKVKQADVESSDAVFIDGNQLSNEEKNQRKTLIQRIEQKGFNQVMEEVAYTWFNRLTALRFMEINEYLPSNVRVLSSSNSEDPIPDLIKEAMSLDFEIDKEWVYERKVNNENDKLFQYLIIKQCNAMNAYMPFMFKKINDYTEILFPEGLLSKNSFLKQMTNVKTFPEEDWSKVEIIGWLYQYYIAEEKDRVIKSKKKYRTEEIPFATQLFTPDWIVRYMVQNSLGRYWVENHGEDKDLVQKWEFYLENPNGKDDFHEKITPYVNKDLKVEEIKCFDPAMGSGHILVYMFDVLYEIYSRCGYMEREIPRLIIENNLYGLDIDDRAYQLACFSLVMKAMQYNSRFLRSIKRNGLSINLASIQETNLLDDKDIVYLTGENTGSKFASTKEFLNQFKDAKTTGSITMVSNNNITDFISNRLMEVKVNPATDIFSEESRDRIIKIIPLILKQTHIMDRRYDITVTNPPYMGGRYMPQELSEYISTNYPDYKGDLFSVFISYITSTTKKSGHIGLITPYVWMFIKNYLKLRQQIVQNNTISSMIELEYNSFEGATVPVCTFTLRNYSVNTPGEFIKLAQFKGIDKQPVKTREAITNPKVPYRYTAMTNDFKKVTGYRIAYWFSEDALKVFNYDKLEDYIDASASQNKTSDNKRFLRYFWEVDKNSINERWAFYTKGGEYRKWYGNILLVVDWSDEARKFYKSNATANLLNNNYWFREGLTYNSISNRGFSVRKVGRNIYDMGGPTIHPNNKTSYILGLLNNKCMNEIMNLYNPTLNYQLQDVKDIPVLFPNEEKIEEVEAIVNENVKISKEDWDSNETSWDFVKHPILYNIIEGEKLIENYVDGWVKRTSEQYLKLKKNEEKLNEIFINLYGLDNEISPSVENRDVTISIADHKDCVKSFLSYAIGCMFGRYSLDNNSLQYAGGGMDTSNYQTINVDKDNILPVLSGAYFEDDIVSRLVDFVKIIFGEETLGENLEFIAGNLGKKKNETAKETIRRYFLNNFFKDHVQKYKKRPIYWLFSSGKQKAFNCLIYMHRYDSTTLGRIRTDYLHELQTRMEAEKESLLNIIDGDSTSKEITQAKKELISLEKKIEELKDYDEVLHHMADQQIEIDLDDGVEVNYAKFKDLLVKK